MNHPYRPLIRYIMRTAILFVLLIPALSGLAGAAAGHAQDNRLTNIEVDLNVHQTPLGEVLQDLEQQTGLAFGYSHAYLDLQREVSLRVEDQNMQQTLQQLFDGTRTTWTLSNGVVQLKTWPEEGRAEGVLAGTITDAETGEPMAGATMQLEGTTLGAPAGPDGTYRLEGVEPGVYTLIFSFVGYQRLVVPDIEVLDGQVTTVDVQLVPSAAQMGEVVVEAEVDVNTAPVIEATNVDVVNTIAQSSMVLTGISSEQISKTPDSDAAEVVRRAPGVTLSGSYVNLRGLSDRHTATFIDGMSAPSTAAYSSSFSYNLLPAGVIDRVLVYKSPAAELPGDWGGGVVKVFTKNTSVARELEVSFKGEYDNQASFSDYYTHAGSDTDWLGYDGGTRRIPDKFFSYDLSDETGIQNTAAARVLPETWSLLQARSNLNWDGKLRYYDSWKPFGLRINNLTALKYSRSTDFETSQYSDLLLNRETKDIRNNNEPIPEAERTPYEELLEGFYKASHDSAYSEKVRASVMQNLGFWFSDGHRLRLKNFFNQLGHSRTATKIGHAQLFTGDYANNILNIEHYYRQQTLYNGQLSGVHELGAGHRLDWQGGYSYARQQEPDRRIMEFGVEPASGDLQTLPAVLHLSSAPEINSRTWTDSREDIYTLGLDYNWQTPWGGTLKAGGYAHRKDRDYSSRLIYFDIPKENTVNGGLRRSRTAPWLIMDDSLFIDAYFKPDPGFIQLEPTSGQPDPASSFRAENEHRAGYLSLKTPLFNGIIDLYGGLRYEWDDRDLATYGGDSTGIVPILDETGKPIPNRSYSTKIAPTTHWLPSAGLTVRPVPALQLRATAGRTLDRPSLREASTFYFFDYVEYIRVQGNPLLTNSEIWNYDVRAEWYPRPGEQVTLGGFYKAIDAPIEQIRFSPTAKKNRQTWVNTDEGTVYGVELEVRKRLDFIPAAPFEFLSVFGNATWLYSEVRADSVLLRDGTYDQLPVDKRQLQGAAPYVVNAGLSFDHPGWDTQASVLYNLTGPQLIQAAGPGQGLTVAYSVYRRRYQQVDLQVARQLAPKLQLKATVENLLGGAISEFLDANYTQKWDPGVFVESKANSSFENTDSVIREYDPGRTVSLSIKMTL